MSFSSVPGVLLAKLVVKMSQGEKENPKDKKEKNEKCIGEGKWGHTYEGSPPSGQEMLWALEESKDSR